MLSANEAELGIVQVDTLKEMSEGDENIRSLQAVLPLHANLLHIIAASEGSLVGARVIKGVAIPGTGDTVVIRKFSELKGMTVAAVGTAQLMGQTLERMLRYGMKFVVAESDEHALSLLKGGQVQAVFTLGGWPLPAISRLKASNGVHLVNYDLEARSPYVGVKRNYQNLEAFNLNFLGVPNLLVSRPFKSGGAMSRQVATLQSCIKHPSQTHGVAPIQTSSKVGSK
jgi:TRAP-type uncharacterized transport system substrate-binding protein